LKGLEEENGLANEKGEGAVSSRGRGVQVKQLEKKRKGMSFPDRRETL